MFEFEISNFLVLVVRHCECEAESVGSFSSVKVCSEII